MNCRRVEQLLSEHMEGRLTGWEADAVAHHLDGCPACRQRQETFAALGTELRGLADLLPPPDMARRAIARWAAESSQATADGRQTSRRNGFWLPFLMSPRLAPAGAALAVAAVAAALAFTAAQRERRPTGISTPRIVIGPPLPFKGSPPDNQVKGLGHGRSPVIRPQYSKPDPSQGDPRRLPEGSRFTANPTWPVAPPEAPRRRGLDLSPEQSTPPLAILPRSTDDLKYLNGPPEELPRWVPIPQDEWEELEGKVRRYVQVKDDFIMIPFPRIAHGNAESAVVQAVEAYKKEAAVVDPRLAREVTLQFKGAALSDLCDRLRTDAGIQLAAGRSVADEKVTLLCRTEPLRDVMRQLSRPFGYTWLRSGKAGEYRYELVQDLKSQLTEEELRNQDRNAALLALQKDLDRYRPYLTLSPDEALARWKTAGPAEKKLLAVVADKGWGLIQMYFRLSPPEQAALRAGRRLSFHEEPRGSDRPLPKDIARGVLQSLRYFKVLKGERGLVSTTDLSDPRGQALTAVPEVKAKLVLDMPQTELGEFRLGGVAGFDIEGTDEDIVVGSRNPLAVGVSPAVLKPENAVANRDLKTDPALKARYSVQPAAGHPFSTASSSAPSGDGRASVADKKVTSADTLEALHRATGMPIVADYFTRLFKPEAVTVKNRPLFETLSRMGDALHMRWRKDGEWLQFRSTSFFNDRLKEVPNRLLNRWAAARRQSAHSMGTPALTLDDLVEIAGLPDAQLDARDMAEGAKELYGLEEWDLACYKTQRPHLRFLSQLTPARRQAAMSAAGLPFTKMALAQQQQFITFALQNSNPLQSLEELGGATLRVDYSLPGGFQWGDPANAVYTQWVVPFAAGPQGKRVPRPVVREKTREATLQALKKVDPQLRQALWQAMRRHDPRLPDAPPDDEAQIFPTQLRLAIVYIPGSTNARDIRVLYRDNVLVQGG